MSTIGKILEETKNGRPYRHGYIATLNLNLSFTLEPNTAGNGPLAPDFVILTQNMQGKDTQVGAAWKRTINKPGQPPSEMLSLTFDDPSFPHALNVAAFKGKDGWDITFRRRQERQAA